MKIAFKPFLVLFCACGILACSNNNDVVEEQVLDQKRPLVDYEVVPGDDPFTFTFKNKSTNFKDLEWRFGDDSLSVDDSPSHVFLSTGRFEVNLKATSETGATAKKIFVINIDPDKAVKVSASKFGDESNDEVKFSVTSTAEIESVTWDFGDQSPGSTDMSPVKKYQEGKLFTSKASVKTKKGSVVTVSKLVSSNGTLVEVINNYLLNVGPKFRTAQRVGTRWGIVADWTVNAAVKQRDGGMGSWDEWQGNSMSLESWGGEPDINNGKIEQTSLVPVEAGQYYYELKYYDYQIKDDTYLVAAKGSSLPDIEKVTTDPNVLGYLKIFGNQDGGTGPLLYMPFKVDVTQPVTFGFVSTMVQNDQTMKLTYMKMYRQE
jgi:PKD repeat protein